MRYHVSADGVSRPCKAKTQDSCRAVSSDGQSAPHGEFDSPEEARRFAEKINENQYESWETTSKGGYFADGVGANEESIAARSETVLTGADLTIDEDEVDSEGRLSDLPEDSSLRFVRDDDPSNFRPSGYQAWKVYGSEKDVSEFMEQNEIYELDPYVKKNSIRPAADGAIGQNTFSEESIAARSEAVMTGADLTIDEDEIDSEGRLSDLPDESTLRFVRDDDPKNSRPSGYQAWKVYGSEKDISEFMDMGGDSAEFSYGKRKGDWGESMPITIAPAGVKTDLQPRN